MRFSRIVLVTAVLAASLLAAGCGSDEPSGSGRAIVAGFYPLAFAAKTIGGDGAEVVNLTPVGAEPHDLELTPRDAEVVRDASLVLYLGQGFQPGVEDAVGERDGPSLDLLEGQALLGAAGDGHDPHVWLDPTRYASMARAIATALGDPAAADDLVRRLGELDTELAQGLATCERRELVTSHAAFGYLADRYDLTQIPLTGLSPEAEPTPRDLAALAGKVAEHGATTVFGERLVSPELAETVARETGARTAVLDPLEGLTGDQAEAGDDYFSVMRENLAVLREGLGCT